MQKLLVFLVLLFFSLIISCNTNEPVCNIEEKEYDNFNDGVINTNLWWIDGPVSENNEKLVLSTGGTITALQENIIGMSFSVTAYPNTLDGEHVGIDLGTRTPAGDVVFVGEYIDKYALPSMNNYVFCQWYENGIFDLDHLHHVNLQEAQWGVNYTFGLEYTSDKGILIIVNDTIVYSFKVPGVETAYSQGGAQYWIPAYSVSGGNITAEINWVKIKERVCK